MKSRARANLKSPKSKAGEIPPSKTFEQIIARAGLGVPLCAKDVKRLGAEYEMLASTQKGLEEKVRDSKAREDLFLLRLRELIKTFEKRRDIRAEDYLAARTTNLKNIHRTSRDNWELAADFVEEVYGHMVLDMGKNPNPQSIALWPKSVGFWPNAEIWKKEAA